MKTSKQIICALAAAIALTAVQAFAAGVVNGDFETGLLGPWFQINSPGGVVSIVSDNGSSDPGIFAADVNTTAVFNFTGISQIVLGCGPSTNYQLVFDYRIISAPSGAIAFVQAFHEDSVGNVLSTTGLIGPNLAGGGSWVDGITTAVFGSSNPLASQIVIEAAVYTGPNNAPGEWRFDNIKIIPEPTTYALLAVGCAGLVALRRRQRILGINRGTRSQ